MTYPPQQPGPYGSHDPNQGPWGQQQGGYPQTGSQPGYPGAYPPSGPQPAYPGSGYPQSGPQPLPGYPGTTPQFGQPGGTQQFGQPEGMPQFGGPGGTQQFGQPGQWGAQPGVYGYPGGPAGQPPKKKTGLIVGAVIAAVLLIGGGVTAVLLLTGDTDPHATPEALQNAVIDAYNTKNAQKFVPLMCVPPPASELQTLQATLDKIPQGVVYSSSRAPEVTGTSGTLTLQAAANGRAKDFPLKISGANGSWCLSS